MTNASRRHKFQYRYSVERWGKKPEVDETKDIAPGIVETNSKYGYSDDLFIISMVVGDGDQMSCLPISASDGGFPKRDTLLAVRDLINHWLEEHYSHE